MSSGNDDGRSRLRLRTMFAVKLSLMMFAVAAAGVGGPSVANAEGEDPQNFTIILCPPFPITPAAPQNLRQPDTSVALRWDEVPCAAGYNVHDANGGFVKSVKRPGFHPAIPGESYYVTAYSGRQISDRSEVLKVLPRNCPNTTPAAPQRVRQWSNRTSLRWDFKSCIDGYNIHTSDGAYVTTVVCNCWTGARRGERYFVTAFYNAKISGRSNVDKN